jgi:hypothetical protein
MQGIVLGGGKAFHEVLISEIPDLFFGRRPPIDAQVMGHYSINGLTAKLLKHKG